VAPDAEDAVAASGVARGAAIVPASEHAASLRAEREPAEGFEDADARAVAAPEAAEWTEGEAADDSTVVLPAALPDDLAAEPAREAPAAVPGDDEPTLREPSDEDRSEQGWRSMWGFGRGGNRSDEGKEQR
jgi:hypothetical protein